MITTTHGDMDEATLQRYAPEPIDDENEFTTAVEYWMKRDAPCDAVGHDITVEGQDGSYWERVHRSAHVTLKRVPEMGAQAGGVN